MRGHLGYPAHCRKGTFNIGFGLVAPGLQVHFIGMRIIGCLLQALRMAADFLKRPVEPVSGYDNLIAQPLGLALCFGEQFFSMQFIPAGAPGEPGEGGHQQQIYQLMYKAHVNPQSVQTNQQQQHNGKHLFTPAN
ncbi:hypothetical protein D3C73_1086090 [compost metagenome]